MKKIKIVALITLLCFICTIPAFAATDWGKEPKNYDVRVFVDNKDNELIFPAGMGKPFIAQGRTFVPYRIMCEALGAEVDWNSNARKVTAVGNGNTVELTIGKKAYKVNNISKTMDVEPFILRNEGRTYIPARHVTEGLDYTIDYARGGTIMFICSFTQGQSEAEMKAILQEIVKANEKPVIKPPVEKERPKAELDREGWLTAEASKKFRTELEKSIKMDRANNTISFYLPLLPEEFEWDIGLNQHFGPKPDDSYYILHDDNRLADGQSYTFDNIRYSEMDRGYFTFGPAKKGLVNNSDFTGINLKTGEIEHYERKW